MITSQTVQQVIVLTNKETSSGNVLGGEGHYLEGGGAKCPGEYVWGGNVHVECPTLSATLLLLLLNEYY